MEGESKESSIVPHFISTSTLYLKLTIIGGICSTPGFLLSYFLYTILQPTSLLKVILIPILLWFCYFSYVLFALLLIPVFHKLMQTSDPYAHNLMPYRKWLLINSLTILPRYTGVLMFCRHTPLLPWFYRRMGMKIGKNVQIFSTNLSDWPLIEIGDNSVISEGVTLTPVLMRKDSVKLEPIKIGQSVVVGPGSVIMAGSILNHGSCIFPGSVLKRATQVGYRELWWGIPARCARRNFEPSASMTQLRLPPSLGGTRSSSSNKLSGMADIGRAGSMPSLSEESAEVPSWACGF
eukprot:gnl/Trimastix_PCT/339.p2 GENE.gnl/Trimastix_PCT/339~~gnl/Trimastix_PCT/339.p2  ORF type:complete len:293 (+),score=59.93 gnl/Trimastix_PCT/339:60-938(+)